MGEVRRQTPVDRTVEEIRVRSWRRRQFMALGFGLPEAQRLTVARVDLGDMRRLLEAGCPLETAQRILL